MACAAILLGRDDLARARRHLERLRGWRRDPGSAGRRPDALDPRPVLRRDGRLAGAREALALLPDTGMAPTMLLDPAFVEAAMAATPWRTRALTPVLAAASGETPWTRAIRAILEGRPAEAARECASAHERHLRVDPDAASGRGARGSRAGPGSRGGGVLPLGRRDALSRAMEPGVDPVLTDTG